MPEVSYLAGLIDGGGTITLTKSHAKEAFREVNLSVWSPDKLVAEHLKTVWGGTIIRRSPRGEMQIRGTYVWRVVGRKAISIIEEVAERLHSAEKKARAQHIVKNYDAVTLRNGRYSKRQMAAKANFEESFFCL